MVTSVQEEQRTFALRPRFDRDLVDGAWWPQSRSLNDQLKQLFAQWPPEAGRIQRILYSPPDWDDHPRIVSIPGRSIRAGCFPRDDTHLLTLTLANDKRLRIQVIPPDATAQNARAILDDIAKPKNETAQVGWENEGGHV